MKKSKLILAILCLALGFALAACSDDDEEKKDTGVKEAGVDMPKTTPDKGPDKKVTQPDKGTDGVTTPDLGADGVTTPDMSADSALPDMPPIPDMPKTSCSYPFKYITLSGGKGSVQGEVKSTEKTSKVTLAATSCTKTKTQGAEHFYAVYLVSNVKYYIMVSPSSSYNVGFYVFTDCTKIPATCIAGADANYSGSAESVTFTPPVTGVYFIGVDSQYAPGTSLSYGKYTVSVQEAKAPKNDTCTGATTLSFPTGKMSISETGTTLFASNKSSLTIAGCTKKTSAGPEVFYKINMVKDTLYKLKLDSGTSGYNESLYIFSDCAKIASSCVAGADSYSSSSEEISFTPKTTGVYYIAVDGQTSTSKGSYTLTIDKFEKPANDACNKATKVTLVGGKLAVKGHTIGATNSVKLTSSGCTKKTLQGPDVFYSADLKAGTKYRVTLTPASGYNPAVFVLSSCSATACVAGADVSYSGSAEKVDITPKTTGTFYIGVGTSYAATSTYAQGKFDLEIAEIVAPGNDVCSKASKMTFAAGKASVKGDTSFASNSINLPSTGCTKKDTEGPDMFYAADLKAGQAYKIKLTPATGYDAALYVLSSCASTACEAGVDTAYSGSAESLTFIPKATKTYYIAVDTNYAASSTYAAGKFTLDVEEYNPPKGDSCAKPIPLTFSGKTATASGDTSTFSSSVALTSSSCTTYSSPGNDAFYSVTLTGGKAYKVTLTPASTFDSMLYVFTNCSNVESSCVGGHDNIGSGNVESVKVNPSTTTTYFIGVDSYSSSQKGKFTIKVEETAPPPTNSKCAGAKTISMPGGKGTLTADTSISLNEYGSTVSCHSTYTYYLAPQLYYKQLMKKGLTYKFELSPTFYSYMYLFPMSACGAATKINTACKSGSTQGGYVYVSSGSTGSIVYTSPVDQWMVVAVDGSSASYSGKFTLNSSIVKKATNDTCATATPITLTAGKGKASGDTTGATDTSGATVKCGGSSTFAGKDVFYSVNLKAGQAYSIGLTPKFTGYVYVFRKSSCGTLGKIQADCASTGLDGDYKGSIYSGSTGYIKFKPVKGGDYIIAVDSTSTSYNGSFDLTVDEFKAAANDTCATAQKVTLVGGKATVTGTKGPTASNWLNKCGTSTVAATDLFYKFTPVTGKSYAITFTPVGGGRFGVWDGNHACASSAVATACGILGSTFVSSSGTLTITAKSGDVYFVADGISGYDNYKFTFSIVEK